MTDEISVEASDVSDVVDAGYVEIVETDAPAEVVADAGPTVETATAEPLDIPDFLAERGYGAPAATGDSQTVTAEPEPMGEDLRSERQKLIDAGIIKPATEEPTGAGAKPEAKDDELKAKQQAKAEAKEGEKPKAEGEKPKAEADKPEKPSWQQRLKAGAQRAGSGLRKAGSGVSKGLRKASSGLRKTTPKSAPKPATTSPKAQTSKPKARPQAAPKATGPSRAQNLGRALGNLAGAPHRAANGLRSMANGMRQALPKSQPPAAEPTPRPKSSPSAAKQATPTGSALGAGQRLGQALGGALGLPSRIAQGVREKLPRRPEEEPKPRGGDERPTRPTSPAPLEGGGGGLPSPGAGIANLGHTLPLGLAGIAVAFLIAGLMAQATQAAGGIKATPMVVIAAFLFAGTFLLMILRR